jgi:tellurium resistance protein TerZ
MTAGWSDSGLSDVRPRCAVRAAGRHTGREDQMNANISKGQTVELISHDGGLLGDLRLGLAWDAIRRPGLSGVVQHVAVDLDASVLLVSADRELLETVYYGKLSTVDGSVEHMGDNLSGQRAGDDESIKVDLAKISPAVAHIVFVVTSYSGHQFHQIENATARILDQAAGDRELARYTLTGSGRHTAVVMGRISRGADGWSFTAIGVPGDARTVRELVPLALSTL